MEEKVNQTAIHRTVFVPVLVLFVMVTSVALMAGSSFFTPIVQFIHSGNITPLQAGACLMFSAAGFAIAYFLLNGICGYFVPRINQMEAGKKQL